MPRSSLRHAREFRGVDAAGETPYMHGEIGADSGTPPTPTLPTADYLCGPGNWTDEGAWVSGEVYGTCKVVSNDGRWFLAYSGHTASSYNEPGVGEGWESRWYEIADPAAGVSIPAPTPGMVREHDTIAREQALHAALLEQRQQLIDQEAHEDELAARAAAMTAWHNAHDPLKPGEPLPMSSWPRIPDLNRPISNWVLAGWMASHCYQHEDKYPATTILETFDSAKLKAMLRGEMPLPWVHREPSRAPAPVPPQLELKEPPLLQQDQAVSLLAMAPDELRQWMCANWYDGNQNLCQFLEGQSAAWLYEQVMTHAE